MLHPSSMSVDIVIVIVLPQPLVHTLRLVHMCLRTFVHTPAHSMYARSSTIHTLVHPFFHMFIHTPVRSFFHAFVHTFVHAEVNTFPTHFSSKRSLRHVSTTRDSETRSPRHVL